MPTLYAHLPGVRMEPDEHPFAGGRLMRLPFEVWRALDLGFDVELTLSDAKYRKSDPVFWVNELDHDIGRDRETLMAAAYPALRDVHLAFLLDRSAPLLPAPTLSCLYFEFVETSALDDGEHGGVLPCIGPMGRELVVHGSPLSLTFEEDRLDDVDALHGYIESTAVRDVRGTVRAAIDVLAETAQPDSWHGGDPFVSRALCFARCIAAAERLLLPPEHDFERGDIAKMFGRHAGALLGALFDDRDGTSEHADGLYRLRSELLQGRKVPSTPDNELNERFAEGRRLLRSAIYSALTLRGHVSDSAPLWRWLAACWEDPAQQEKLIAVLNGDGN